MRRLLYSLSSIDSLLRYSKYFRTLTYVSWLRFRFRIYVSINPIYCLNIARFRPISRKISPIEFIEYAKIMQLTCVMKITNTRSSIMCFSQKNNGYNFEEARLQACKR